MARCAAWSGQRWTSRNGSAPKRRFARTRPRCGPAIEEIQHLAGSLIAAQEAERARIARDLHDDVSQQLAALSIALSGLKRRLRAAVGDDDLQSAMSSIQQSAVALAREHQTRFTRSAPRRAQARWIDGCPDHPLCWNL